MKIETVADLDIAIRKGSYTSIGSYPVFFLTHDGETLSPKAVKENRDRIAESITENMEDEWRVIAMDVNWEDPEMYCADSGERIPSAYAEPEEG